LPDFFRKRIQECYANKDKEFTEQGIITKRHVDQSIKAIQELSIGCFHKVMQMKNGKELRTRFDPTGHLVT
jgi:predicted nucleic acid-binding protein